MIVRKEIASDQPLTPSQIEMLNALAARPVVPDADCPELTPEQLTQFRRISESKRPPETDGHAAALPPGSQKGEIPWAGIYLRPQPDS